MKRNAAKLRNISEKFMIGLKNEEKCCKIEEYI